MQQNSLLSLALVMIVGLGGVVSPLAMARGLNQLQPSRNDENKPDETTPKSSTPDQKEGQEADSEDKDAEPEESKPPEFKDIAFIGTSFSWINLSSNKGGWHSSITSDLTVGYRVAKLMRDRLKVFTTLRYLPVDVIVKHEGTEYRGVVEHYQFGGLLSFQQRDLLFEGGAELGGVISGLNALDNLPKDSSLERSGVNFTLHTGLGWRPIEQVQVGGRVYLGVGIFSSIQVAAHVSFAL